MPRTDRGLTNATREGRSPSESDVAIALSELIRTARGRVAVTTFASNVARLRVVAQAAAACEREVVVVGRAMERIVQVARETGYLDGIQEFRSTDVYGTCRPTRCWRSAPAVRASRARRWHVSRRTITRPWHFAQRPCHLFCASDSGQRKGDHSGDQRSR